MKKKVLLAMAIIVALGSVKAFASHTDDEDVMNMNAATKVEAAQMVNADMDAEESEKIDGAVMASQLMQIEEVSEEVQKLISEVGMSEEGSGLQENSLGQLSSEADSYIREAVSAADASDSTKLNKAYEGAMGLKRQLENIKDRLGLVQ